ncbi:MAG: helix-turn-helix transcriptional regulator [Dinghuibacter sp.]|nr:helix-turn-helix transcriptional regulator [Dinghuibacter sp.]
MEHHFLYKTLEARVLFKQLATVFGSNEHETCMRIPRQLGSGYVQYLALPCGLEVLLSEYNYSEYGFTIEHHAEDSRNLALWIDLANAPEQEFSINNDQLLVRNPVQQHAILLNSAFPYKQTRARGTSGRSLTIFLPYRLVEQLLDTESLNTILGKYYALNCRGIEAVHITPIEERKIHSAFYQWNNHQNYINVARNMYQLLEWFFDMLFLRFSTISDEEQLSADEINDLLRIESVLKSQLTEPAPDLDGLKKITALPFAHIEHRFRHLHKKTMHRYFREEKLKLGREYLAKGRSVRDVAYELGYANPSNFSSSFKKLFQVTPENFLKQLQQN